MKYTIRITRQAHEQLLEIKRYISQELSAPDAALNTIRAIRAEIAKLNDRPTKFGTIDEEPWKSAGFRKIRGKNYYVYFWVDEENRRVQVTAVIYVRREQFRQLTGTWKE